VRNNTMKPRDEGREGSTSGTGADISLQPMERTTPGQISMLWPMEDPTSEQVDIF